LTQSVGHAIIKIEIIRVIFFQVRIYLKPEWLFYPTAAGVGLDSCLEKQQEAL